MAAIIKHDPGDAEADQSALLESQEAPQQPLRDLWLLCEVNLESL